MTSGGTVLALGGGGARGLAHLGVIEVLLEHGVAIDRIVGVSIGSLAGCVYAIDLDILATQERVLDYVTSPGFQRNQRALYGTRRSSEAVLPRMSWITRIKEYLRANRLLHKVMSGRSLLPGGLLDGIVTELIPDVDVSDCALPMTVVAVDLKRGTPVAIESGDLRSAVRGSSSLPGIFPPVPFEDMLLCDFGVLCATPVGVARRYRPDLLLAVDVSPRLDDVADCETALDTLMRLQDIGGVLFHDHIIPDADVVIRPKVGDLEWTDFSRPEECIELGRLAARHALPRILTEPGAGDESPSSRQAV